MRRWAVFSGALVMVATIPFDFRLWGAPLVAGFALLLLGLVESSEDPG